MITVYALRNIETNDLVAEFRHVEDVLSLVWRGIERNGTRDAATLALEVESGDSEGLAVAHGRAPANLARGQVHTGAASDRVP